MGSSGDNRMIFSPQIWLIFLLPTSTELNSQKFGKVPKKNKNLKLIKIAKNWNRAKRKCHTSFFDFDILKMKFVSINSELNSAPGNQS